MDDLSTILIIHYPSSTSKEVPLREEQQFDKKKHHVTAKVKETGRVNVQPSNEKCFEVSTKK